MREKKENVIYSEEFKKEKVLQIESGKYTACQIAKMLSTHRNTVYCWVKKYGKLPPTERIVIETESDYLKYKESQKDNQEMIKLIGKQQILIDYFTTLIKEANAHFSLDLEKLLKKK